MKKAEFHREAQATSHSPLEGLVVLEDCTTSDNIMPTTDRALLLTRVFDAPRSLVFKAWTEPERIKQWWGPRGGANSSTCSANICHRRKRNPIVERRANYVAQPYRITGRVARSPRTTLSPRKSTDAAP